MITGNRVSTRLWQVVGNAVLLVVIFLTVMPYVYMVSASFKPGDELFSIPVKIFPDSLYWGNYDLLFGKTNFVRWFFNSVFIGVSRMVLAVVISLMAGYAFAKFDFRFKNPLFLLLLATLTLPIYVLIVPLYSMMVAFGWTDHYIALILPLAAQAIGVFLSRQYLLSIPDEILDSARVDGAGEWGIFWRIIVPLSAGYRRDGDPVLYCLLERLHLAARGADQGSDVHRLPRAPYPGRPLQPGVRGRHGRLVPEHGAHHDHLPDHAAALYRGNHPGRGQGLAVLRTLLIGEDRYG